MTTIKKVSLSLLGVLALSACNSTTTVAEKVEAAVPTQPAVHSGEQQRQLYRFDNQGVYFSTLSLGTRVNNIVQLAPEHYQLTISSEFVPTNSSSFYGFQFWADNEQTITLSLKYTEHKHRYIPKLSSDRKHWQPLSGLIMSQGDTVAMFNVTAKPEKQWLAAQEIESSADTYAWLSKLTANKPFVKTQAVAKSVLQQDIIVASIEQEQVKPSVVLVARQHPPEIPGGVIAFKAFYQEILSDSELAKTFRSRFNIYTFPLVNPDGADGGQWRHNANGQDLNRDWQAFSQPETRAVRDFVTNKVEKEGKTVWFGIDFHTSYNGPYLLILNEENERKSRTQVIPTIIESAKGSAPLMVQYRRREQNLPYCYNWFFNEFGAEAVTYEEGDETDRNIIRARGQLYAQKTMAALLAQLKATDSTI